MTAQVIIFAENVIKIWEMRQKLNQTSRKPKNSATTADGIQFKATKKLLAMSTGSFFIFYAVTAPAV